MKQVLETGVAFLDGIERRYRQEGIVEYDVILWRHSLSVRVKDQRNQRGMLIGEANKDALPGRLSHLGIFKGRDPEHKPDTQRHVRERYLNAQI